MVASSQKAGQEAATGTPVGISSAHMAAQEAVTAGQPSSQLHDWSIQGLL